MVVLIFQGKRKDTEVVNVMCHLNDMSPGEPIDEWRILNPVNLATKSDVGSLRVRAKYLHEVIMPLKEYSSLKEVS